MADSLYEGQHCLLASACCDFHEFTTSTVAAQMRAWPTPFMERGTPEAGELLAHAGAAQMAGEMYEVLLPHLATTEPLHLTFAGPRTACS